MRNRVILDPMVLCLWLRGFGPLRWPFFQNVTVQFSDARTWTDNTVYGTLGLFNYLRRIRWPSLVYAGMVLACVQSVIWLVAVMDFWVGVITVCEVGGGICGWGELLSLG